MAKTITTIAPLLDVITELGHQHCEALKDVVHTDRDPETGDWISTFRGKSYKNLTYQQVCDLKTCYAGGIYHILCKAQEYQQWLITPFIRDADYYLREMRKQLI